MLRDDRVRLMNGGEVELTLGSMFDGIGGLAVSSQRARHKANMEQ